MCSKKRIFTTPDRTCDHAPRYLEFLAIRSPLAVSIALCRYSIQLFSVFGEVTISRDDIWRTKPFGLLLKIMLKSYAQQNLFSLRYHRSVQGTTPRSNVRHPPRNGRSQRRLEHPPGSNPRVCLDFVSMNVFQQGGAAWLKFVRLVLFLHLSPRVQEGRGEENMAFNAVEAMPTGSKLPAVDDSIRTSMGGRYGFDALAPLLTRALPMYFSRA